MANADPQPWAPDPSIAPGTPPSAPYGGTGGEHGSSSFAGNTDWNADGTAKATAPGPGTGESYHASENPVITDAWGGDGRGAALKTAATVTVTADDQTPTAGDPVELTATVNHTDATGQVTFYEGSTILTTVNVGTGGTAVYTKDDGFAAGAHVISAKYTGNGEYRNATSANYTVTAS